MGSEISENLPSSRTPRPDPLRVTYPLPKDYALPVYPSPRNFVKPVYTLPAALELSGTAAEGRASHSPPFTPQAPTASISPVLGPGIGTVAESQPPADATAPSTPHLPAEAVQPSPFPVNVTVQIADTVSGWTIAAMHTVLVAFTAIHARQPMVATPSQVAGALRYMGPMPLASGLSAPLAGQLQGWGQRHPPLITDVRAWPAS